MQASSYDILIGDSVIQVGEPQPLLLLFLMHCFFVEVSDEQKSGSAINFAGLKTEIIFILPAGEFKEKNYACFPFSVYINFQKITLLSDNCSILMLEKEKSTEPDFTSSGSLTCLVARNH